MAERLDDPGKSLAARVASDIKSIYNSLPLDENDPGSTQKVFLEPETLLQMAKSLPNSQSANNIRKFLELMCVSEDGSIGGLNFSIYLKHDQTGGIMEIEDSTKIADLYFDILNNGSNEPFVTTEEDALIFLDDEIAGEEEVLVTRTPEMEEFEDSQGSWPEHQAVVLIGFFASAAKNSISNQ